MVLAVGAEAPDFTMPDQDGAPVTASALWATGPVVLFFYPAAGTPGCTKEACHFRDLAGEFATLGAHRLGISKDPVAKQAGFASKFDLDYPILSDPAGTVAGLYGVKPALFDKIGPLQRTTFVIGTDGRILEVVEGLFKAEIHADRALEVLRAIRA